MRDCKANSTLSKADGKGESLTHWLDSIKYLEYTKTHPKYEVQQF